MLKLLGTITITEWALLAFLVSAAITRSLSCDPLHVRLQFYEFSFCLFEDADH